MSYNKVDTMAQRQTLPVLPLRGTVIFPGLTAPIAAGRPGTLRAIEAALKATGWKLTDILVTHHHADHTGGILALKEKYKCRVVAPAAEAVDFYIYENWLAGPHKIVLHRSTCGQCNHGKGRPAGHDANHAKWHGPYGTLSEARTVAHDMQGILIRSECKCI